MGFGKQRYGVSINIWFLLEDCRPKEGGRYQVFDEAGNMDFAKYDPESRQFSTADGAVFKAKAFSNPKAEEVEFTWRDTKEKEGEKV